MTIDSLFKVLQIVGLASGVVYITLQVSQHRLMWYFNLVATACVCAWAVHSHIWATAALNLYLFTMSVVGIVNWRRLRKGAEDGGGMRIAELTRKAAVASAAAAVVVGAAVYLLLSRLTDDPSPALDAASMTLSVIAAWWLSRAYIQQYFLWCIANVFTISLCIAGGSWFFAALYSVYICFSIFGYVNWRKKALVVKDGGDR